jgi:lactate racemase
MQAAKFMDYTVPYGKGEMKFVLPDSIVVDIISPKEVDPHPAPEQAVREALKLPRGGFSWGDFCKAQSAVIAINDKTRPVPHEVLLPPLLEKLDSLGISAEHIQLLIATGTHTPMTADEFPAILPEEILARYKVISHDSDNQEDLKYLGITERGTPLWVNARFAQADLKVVIGNIEPHQFQGFSGGAKSAAIGLAGRQTINHNHAMMTHPEARLGEFEKNPARQDIEELGELIGVDLSLNAILDPGKKIVHVLAGKPRTVMESGIPLARQICQIPVQKLYDLMIVSPGGHPKDINIYQAQKGLAHALQVMNEGGCVLLAAACAQGSGSSHYEDWVVNKNSSQEVIEEFKQLGFEIGPHKAYQIARDSSMVNLLLYSDLDPEFARALLLNPIQDFQTSLDKCVNSCRREGIISVGVMPYASATIPYLQNN